MVSHKNYNLNVNEEFCKFLTSKLITFFIDGFTSGMNSQLVAYLLSGSAHIYIGFETLKVKCTHYGNYSQMAFKNARAMLFLKLGGAGNNFQSGSKISWEGCPRPNMTPPIVRKGDFMSDLNNQD